MLKDARGDMRGGSKRDEEANEEHGGDRVGGRRKSAWGWGWGRRGKGSEKNSD